MRNKPEFFLDGIKKKSSKQENRSIILKDAQKLFFKNPLPICCSLEIC